jgi:class 3 adenylate cyclase
MFLRFDNWSTTNASTSLCDLMKGFMFNLECDSGHEIVHAASLCFKRRDIEAWYRTYQFEIASKTLLGKFGALSITTILTFVNMMDIFCKNTINLSKKFSHGSLAKMAIATPMTLFCLYHQFRIHLKNETSVTRQICRNFVSQYVAWFAFCDSLFMFVNDLIPEHEGCDADRFRCPFSFSSSNFGARSVAFSAFVIFHLTQSTSFVEIVFFIMILFGANRAIGLLVFHGHVVTSLWSLSCTYLPITIFLYCRYWQELNDRKLFLLQLNISRLQSNFQEVLDSMMPPSISERIKSGQIVIDPCASAAVLLCTLPYDASSQQDAMQAYKLLDQIHRAFDILIQDNAEHARKVDFVGSDYLVASNGILRGRASDDHDGVGSITLARLADEMRDCAQQILAGSGLVARFGLAAGPAIAAVLGERRRYLRILGEAMDIARSLCEQAEPWQVLAVGYSMRALSQAGVSARAVGACTGAIEGEILELQSAMQRRPSSAAAGPFGTRAGFKNLTDLGSAAERQYAFDVREVVSGVAEASTHLADGGDAALADAEEETRFRLETGDRPDSGGDSGPVLRVGGTLRTIFAAMCQGLFLLGLAGYDGDDAPRFRGLRGWVTLACVVAGALAGVASLAAPWLVSQEGRWAAMHATFFTACLALAHARPDPFLLLGVAMSMSLCIIAPPFASPIVARYAMVAALAAFLAVFTASSARDGQSQLTFTLILPLALLAYCVPAWLRREGCGARVRWVLEVRLRRERAALWAALRDLLPEYVLEVLGRGEEIEPHTKQVVVLQADMCAVGPGATDDRKSSVLPTWRSGMGSDGSGKSSLQVDRVMVEGLHELLTLFDREVCLRMRARKELPS